MTDRVHLKLIAALWAVCGIVGSASEKPADIATGIVLFGLGGIAYIASFFAGGGRR